MSATDNLKEIYAQLLAGRKYGNYKLTITIILHRDYPCFLMYNSRWVDMLLEAEWDFKDINGSSSLVYLFSSNKLGDLNFSN